MNAILRSQVNLVEARTAEEAEAKVRARFRHTPQDKIHVVENEAAQNGHYRLLVDWEPS